MYSTVFLDEIEHQVVVKDLHRKDCIVNLLFENLINATKELLFPTMLHSFPLPPWLILLITLSIKTITHALNKYTLSLSVLCCLFLCSCIILFFLSLSLQTSASWKCLHASYCCIRCVCKFQLFILCLHFFPNVLKVWKEMSSIQSINQPLSPNLWLS